MLALVGGMCVGVVFIGIMIGTGQVGDLTPAISIALGAACIFLALFGFYRTVQSRKTHHIDISGTGQIRLAEYSAVATSPCEADSSRAPGAGEVVSLMADSTVWPGMLLLRLKKEDQQITALLVLPDSIDGDGFRALSVACRWIAAHNNPAEHTNM